MKPVLLPPIKEKPEYYEAIEKAIKEHLKREIYIPLVRDFGLASKTIQNEMDALNEALRVGTVTYNRGVFSGKFNSKISLRLQQLGARFDRRSATYRLQQRDLPQDLVNVINATDYKFQQKIDRIDDRLAAIVPEKVAETLKLSKLFDRTIWQVESDFQKSVRAIGIRADLTPEQSKRIAAEWSENMQLWVQDFTKKEILDLRANMQKSVFAGNRYDAAKKAIQESYDTTANKAKFLARQETSLLMTKFKQTRYQAAGVEWYKWGCVSGTKIHPVRPYHLKNKDKFFRWDDPPTVNAKGDRKNPGQDYNCRCYARPVVGYKPGR